MNKQFIFTHGDVSHSRISFSVNRVRLDTGIDEVNESVSVHKP